MTNNDGQNTRIFSENGSFIFEFEDKAGNPGSVVAQVTNIDKIVPTATLTYSDHGADQPGCDGLDGSQ